MTKDALGNQIIPNTKYGYTQSNNGHIHVVVGTADEVKTAGKVTLRDCVEAKGIYGKTNSFCKVDRKRTVNGCMVFPVYDTTIASTDDDEVCSPGYNR